MHLPSAKAAVLVELTRLEIQLAALQVQAMAATNQLDLLNHAAYDQSDFQLAFGQARLALDHLRDYFANHSLLQDDPHA
jgi:hypothetical protein